jgi:hypothetical protein
MLAAAAAAALVFSFAGIANAAVGGLDGIHAGSSLVQKTGMRHKHCAWRHGHRHCWWH